MRDIFESKGIKPMLIGEIGEAFDSPDYIYELKLDGERCIAYLDPKKGTEFRNKRNMIMNTKVPELREIHEQVKCRCILDGELIVIKDGKPDFFEIQRRSLTTNSFKIRLQASKYPASFTAFDILYYEGITQFEVLKSIVTVKGKLNLGFLGYKDGENKFTYPSYDSNKAKVLLTVLKSLADFVIVDCTSSLNNILSATAIEECDTVIRLASPDPKSMSYFISQLPLYTDPKYKMGQHIVVLNNRIAMELH